MEVDYHKDLPPCLLTEQAEKEEGLVLLSAGWQRQSVEEVEGETGEAGTFSVAS